MMVKLCRQGGFKTRISGNAGSLLFNLGRAALLAAFTIVGFTSSGAGQQDDLIANGSFEAGPDPEISVQLDAGSAGLEGWKIIYGNLDYIGKRWRASDGKRCIDLNGSGPGAIEQRIGGLTVGRRYRLAFDMAVNPEAPPSQTYLLVMVGGVSNFCSMVRGGNISNLGWRTYRTEFEAKEPGTKLRLISLNRRWAGPALDNISLRPVELLKEVSNPAGAKVGSTGFSTNLNPNGVWRCGWKSTFDGPLLLLTTARWSNDSGGTTSYSWQLNDTEWPAVSAVISEGNLQLPGRQFLCAKGEISIAPGMTDAPEHFGVVRFTAPYGGDFRVQVSAAGAADAPIQGDADFHVLTNSNEVFGLLLAPGASAAYTNDFSLVAGDTVDLLVGRGWDLKHADSRLKISARVQFLGATNGPVFDF